MASPDGRQSRNSVSSSFKGKIMSNWLIVVLFCVELLAVGWAVGNPSASAQPNDKDKDKGKDKEPAFRAKAVRYQIKDVVKALKFYTTHLGFNVELDAAPAFAAVSNGSLTLYLSGPKSSGARPLPDGRKQE